VFIRGYMPQISVDTALDFAESVPSEADVLRVTCGVAVRMDERVAVSAAMKEVSD
jgi:hypothetical protein